jgi:hypothetical protein
MSDRSQTSFKFELGVTVRDVINGYEGPITGRAQYLTGCTQYLVANSSLDKDGKVQDGYWIDEGRLELKAKTKPITLDRAQPPGGPTSRETPSRRR